MNEYITIIDILNKRNAKETLTEEEKNLLNARNEAYTLFGEIFLNLRDAYLAEMVRYLLDRVPTSFFTRAASSTGKYHPASDLGNGGTVRHTYAVANILSKFLSLEHIRTQLTVREQKLLMCAALLHDCLKYGWNDDSVKYTVAAHPMLAAEFVRKNADIYLSPEETEFVASAIETHMGEWNTDKYDKSLLLKKPETLAQKLLHEADYIAASKDIYTLFDDTVYLNNDTKTVVLS